MSAILWLFSWSTMLTVSRCVILWLFLWIIADNKNFMLSFFNYFHELFLLHALSSRDSFKQLLRSVWHLSSSLMLPYVHRDCRDSFIQLLGSHWPLCIFLFSVALRPQRQRPPHSSSVLLLVHRDHIGTLSHSSWALNDHHHLRHSLINVLVVTLAMQTYLIGL